MKKLFLLLSFPVAQMVCAQNAPINFEPGGFGASFTWATFEAPAGETNPVFSVVPNISVDAANSSATVAKMDISYATAAGWGSAGCETMHNADLGAFSFTNQNNFVSVQFYQVGFAAPVAVKFATPTGAAFPEVVVQNTIADAWVTAVFDLSQWIGNPLGGQPDQFIFFPSYAPRSTGHTVYFDNVVFSSEATVGVNELPTTAFEVFPNPSSEAWTLSSKGALIHSVVLFDILGKQVAAYSPLSDLARIDAQELKAGVYIAQIRTAEGMGAVKLVKR